MLVCLEGVIPETSLVALRELLTGAPFASGAATAAPEATRIKHNLQLPAAHPHAIEAAQIVVAACAESEAFQAATLPAASTSPRFCRYETGMHYGAHHDSPIMGGANRFRSDIAVTFSLVAADAYDGGELVIDTEGAPRLWKGEAGDCVIYPANTRHRVEPVRKGARAVAICWIQSLVRDPAKRRILFELWSCSRSLHASATRSEEDRIRRSHGDLLRMWAEP
jgi:PKHD-type hydroxylase